MSKEQNIAELRARAAKYRAFARQATDDLTAREVFTLAAELEQQARDIEQNK
jgi:hypothetical protein